MALPQRRTVTGHVNSLTGPATGTVTFTSAVWLRSPGLDTGVPTIRTVAHLNSDGDFTVSLPVNDDPAWAPSGWAYAVEIQLTGWEKLRGVMALPTGDGLPIDLFSLMVPDGAAPSPVTNYVLLALLAQPNGVATLGSDGKLTASQLPASAGGDPTWDEILNKPLTFPPAAHTHAGIDIAIREAHVTTGNVTPQASGSFAVLTGGPQIAVPAQAGDFVEIEPSAQILNNGTFFDLCVVVTGVPARFASLGGASAAPEGDPSMYNQPGTFRTTGTKWGFTAAAGDIENGNVTFAFAVKGNGTGTLYASADPPFRWTARRYRGINLS